MNQCNRCNQTDIIIIQGDTYQKNVSITAAGIFLSAIESVYFSCGKLNLTKQLEYDQSVKCWVLLLTSQETESLKLIETDYDITIKFFDDKIRTALYRGKLKVLDKNNPVEAF